MKFKTLALSGMLLMAALVGNLAAQQQLTPAQDDKFNSVDTIYVEPYRINAQNWGINVSMFNDEEILAISVPLTFSAGKNRLVADSTIFAGGRAESFRVKFARVDTSTQCLTIGLIADVGISVPPIPAGKGRIATIFVSSMDKKDIEGFKVDTTTTPPSNSLLLVTPPSEGIVPALVVKSAGKEPPKEAVKEAVKEEKKPEAKEEKKEGN
jgi:hypothetical protein